MPPFPERESSILAKLKKKKGPSTVTDLEEAKRERSADVNGGPEPAPASTSAVVGPSRGPRLHKLRGAWCPQFRTPDGVLGGLTQMQYLSLDCQTVIWGSQSAPTSPLGFGFGKCGHSCVTAAWGPLLPPRAGFQGLHLLGSSSERVRVSSLFIQVP